MSQSDQFKESFYPRSTGVALITLIQMRIGQNDFYYADNNEPVNSSVSGSTQVYQPAMFRVGLGDDDKDSTSSVTLDFDVGDVQMVRRLQEAQNRPLVTVWSVLSTDFDNPENGPMDFEMSDFNIDKSSISMSLEVEPILREPVPGNKFTPKLFPGLWTNIRIE